jgi:hypothetical protein
MASGSTGRNVTDFVNEHQPDFRSKIQALVFAVHLHFVKEGCRLRALKEDDEEKNLAAAPGVSQKFFVGCFLLVCGARKFYPSKANFIFMLSDGTETKNFFVSFTEKIIQNSS